MMRKPKKQTKNSLSVQNLEATAVRILAIRAHTRAEMRTKLIQREFIASDVEQFLDKAETHGWIDDYEASRGLVSEQIRRGGHGRKWVQNELEQKAVVSEMAHDLLFEL